VLSEGTTLVFTVNFPQGLGLAAALDSLRDLPITRSPVWLLYCAENGQCGVEALREGGSGEAARATHCNSWWRPHRAEIRRSHHPSPAAAVSPGV
jgi:hypothetical protein